MRAGGIDWGHAPLYMGRLARDAAQGAVRLIWPPQSLLSAALVSSPGSIEPELWAKLTFLGPPCCAKCGWPFATIEAPDALCGPCLAKPPVYDAARAALAYDDASRPLLLELKHLGRRDGLKTYARWMVQAAGPVLQQADLIAPVPLHWTRLLQRRFNQSAWLAQALGHVSGRPVDLFGLRRVKRRRSQAGLSLRQRAINVRGAFAVKDRRFAGKSVLLVDDVHTTGATLQACARALRRGGAVAVFALTLARVVRPGDAHI